MPFVLLVLIYKALEICFFHVLLINCALLLTKSVITTNYNNIQKEWDERCATMCN